ncbi:MAG: hypothetical protein J0I07_41800, partial [Myxococcales bacterium]|nr:hypothetical protein [Myxococcales bacterium]
EELGKYFSDVPCEACHGHRLKPEALCVKIGGKHIGEIAELSVRGAGEWFASVPDALNTQQNDITGRVLKEIRERLSFLLDVGLNYLTLARSSGTLSGGESQRIRLASQIGSGLTGVLYVLDEPSIGLHQRDNARLLDTLKRLRDLGNTVIVVEHDEDAIRLADHVVDVGPGAGVHGGHIVAKGTPDDIMANPKSLTGQYLTGERFVAKVSRVAGAIDSRLRAMRVEMNVENSGKRLLPGAVAEVTLPLTAASARYVIPKAALVDSTTGTFVVRVEGQKAKWVRVEVGQEHDGKVEVFGDLRLGDLLAARANEELRDGATITATTMVKP